MTITSLGIQHAALEIICDGRLRITLAVCEPDSADLIRASALIDDDTAVELINGSWYCDCVKHRNGPASCAHVVAMQMVTAPEQAGR